MAAPDQRVDCDYDPIRVRRAGRPAARGGRVSHGPSTRPAAREARCTSAADVAKEMVAAGVEPWAHNGIPAVVYGPTGGKGAMIDSFIGQLGLTSGQV